VIFMAELSDTEIDLALSRGAEMLRSEPLAQSVRYDRRSHAVRVRLSNGCHFSFPARLVEGLETAQPDQLSEVKIRGIGTGLVWPGLDVDVSVQGLLMGIFGSKAYMARRAGQARSPAKAASSRANGKKGGRPPKHKAT
jgi:Protein of unknown function (DUF2442)